MSEIACDIVTKLTPFIATGVGVFLAAWLALAKFYQERLWERKSLAYSAILDALHHIKRYWDFQFELLRYEGHAAESYEKKHANLVEQNNKAFAELLRWRDVGGVIISPAAVNALEEFRSDLAELKYESHSWADNVVRSCEITNFCLAAMRTIASDELAPISVIPRWQKKANRS
ncbi:hypothetical protein [Dongia sp.]|uniref:hypothetical protein n=1 Tax=Dongia sp. TaxID=1977262 RepID=UPI0035ADF3F3